MIFLIIIFSVPLYAVLIWSYFEPRESLLWGKRWMYKEEPEISESAIRYTKIASIATIVFITLIIVLSFFI
ncbi:hypothetical protein PghCCS26_59990 [Paenibacillus glycanilyticus]|uniref:DUF6199 domain-containing protein n=1 Tax=Paenibacillus glycanilyticus TaxID=126569 RepID=A0ABQ6NY25_9BACL|nr:hypothetical protein PghCCS26_59990 [Paenibacillus glycanilyticus]